MENMVPVVEATREFLRGSDAGYDKAFAGKCRYERALVGNEGVVLGSSRGHTINTVWIHRAFRVDSS